MFVLVTNKTEFHENYFASSIKTKAETAKKENLPTANIFTIFISRSERLLDD